MDKNNFEAFLKWGMENDENKEKAIQTACALISVLSHYNKNNISEDKLKKIIGGVGSLAEHGRECKCEICRGRFE